MRPEKPHTTSPGHFVTEPLDLASQVLSQFMIIEKRKELSDKCADRVVLSWQERLISLKS